MLSAECIACSKNVTVQKYCEEEGVLLGTGGCESYRALKGPQIAIETDKQGGEPNGEEKVDDSKETPVLMEKRLTEPRDCDYGDGKCTVLEE